jgi:hypothetical protein
VPLFFDAPAPFVRKCGCFQLPGVCRDALVVVVVVVAGGGRGMGPAQ